ncbi:MAG: hypothetical protein ACP5G7_04660 [Anaerolineae bacterium]
MVPLEVTFGALALMFTLIGLARGCLRELGVTTVLMFVLFFLHTFEKYVDQSVGQVMAMSPVALAQGDQDVVGCWVFVGSILGAAFISYQGHTLEFPGQPPMGVQAVALGLLTGAVNGYLIVGSLWYYLDQYAYPLEFLGVNAESLSEGALALLPFLPQPFLGQPMLFGQSLFLYLSLLLLLARVIR